MTCPRHDHGRNWLAFDATRTEPCGCVIESTTVERVTRYTDPIAIDAPEPAPPAEARCDAPRTPHGVVRCYHPAGHPGPHSWEKTQ